MTRLEMDTAAVHRACCGNELALDFLKLWSPYVHAIDDIIDGHLKEPEGILAAFALAIRLYGHPFYLRHYDRLSQIALSCTSAYADSVAWENSDQKWQKDFADVYRHFGQEMVLAVAGICAQELKQDAYAHMRSISQEWRTMSFFEHHDQEGRPT